MRKFHSSIGDVRSLPDGVAEWQQEQPSREASVSGDVLVPVLQSIVSAVLVASCVTFAGVRLGYEGDGLHLWGGAFLAVVTGAWLALLNAHRRLLWYVETVTGQDIDQNGEVGKPGHLVFVDREKAKQQSAKDRKRDEWTLLMRFVEGIPHKGTALAVWSELGRARYCEFRDMLIDYGFGSWCSVRPDGVPNKSQGWKLTASVEDIHKALFAMPLD